mgnify:FL=1
MSGVTQQKPVAASRPRVGFLGTGRIGLFRMQSLADAGLVEAAVVADPSPEMREAALKIAPEAEVASSLDDLLSAGLDAIVIATPSALHAEQSIAAFEAGLSVFCQKPLGRTEAEVRAVVDAARAADRLLGVDFSYRHTAGMQRIRQLVTAGTLGHVFAADLVFHNAYGPDKPWFFDKALSGGGAAMDLGCHLVDLALWTLGCPDVTDVSGRLVRKGQPIRNDSDDVEDYASATFMLASGTQVRIACSWHLHAGRDAVIGAEFYGTEGGASFSNVGGSFMDFRADHHTGTGTRQIAEPPEDWMRGAITQWAEQLAAGKGFDPAAEEFVTVANVLDRIYAR